LQRQVKSDELQPLTPMLLDTQLIAHAFHIISNGKFRGVEGDVQGRLFKPWAVTDATRPARVARAKVARIVS
jgi:hypothetical protein